MDKTDKLRIMNHIRQTFRMSQLIQSAFVVSKYAKGLRGGKRYSCLVCGEGFEMKDIQIDHIIPIVPYGMKKLDMSLDHYAEKIFCKPDNLQPLCKPCHLRKSNQEKINRDGAVAFYG